MTTFHVAVSDTRSQTSVYLDQGGRIGQATTLAHVAQRRRAMGAAETVDARLLADIVDRDTIRSARIIKIDVEGAEWPVVKSLRALLPSVSPRTEFILEINQELVRRSGRHRRSSDRLFHVSGFRSLLHRQRLYRAVHGLKGAPRRVETLPSAQFSPGRPRFPQNAQRRRITSAAGYAVRRQAPCCVSARTSAMP